MAASKQTSIHTHVRNAVTLVWGSLRLAPMIFIDICCALNGKCSAMCIQIVLFHLPGYISYLNIPWSQHVRISDSNYNLAMPTWEESLHICSAELLVDMLCNIFHMTYCDRKNAGD